MRFAQLAVIGLVALLGPALAYPKGWHLPIVLGELVAGIAIGRTGLGIVDAGNPAAFVRADQVGLRGDEMPDELSGNPQIMDVLEEIRSKVSVKLGLYTSWRDGFKRYRTWPKIAARYTPQCATQASATSRVQPRSTSSTSAPAAASAAAASRVAASTSGAIA